MTLLAKARQNRLIALAVNAELKKRRVVRDAAVLPVFRSVRDAANLNRAPAASRAA